MHSRGLLVSIIRQPARSDTVRHFAIALGMLTFGAAAQTPAPGGHLDLTAENLARVIDPLMAAWVDQHKGPGAVVVVVTRDATIFAKGYGLADIEAKRPFTTDATLVRPGSISKLFTGIAVMQLVDAGKLDLDGDVNDYIDFKIPTPDGGVPVTLRRLLTHRAGFRGAYQGIVFARSAGAARQMACEQFAASAVSRRATSKPIPTTASLLPAISSNAPRASLS